MVRIGSNWFFQYIMFVTSGVCVFTPILLMEEILHRLGCKKPCK